MLSDAILVANEMVTNAVLHFGCSEKDAIEMNVRLGAERVLIIVSDPGCAEQSGSYRVRAEMATPNSQPRGRP